MGAGSAPQRPPSRVSQATAAPIPLPQRQSQPPNLPRATPQQQVIPARSLMPSAVCFAMWSAVRCTGGPLRCYLPWLARRLYAYAWWLGLLNLAAWNLRPLSMLRVLRGRCTLAKSATPGRRHRTGGSAPCKGMRTQSHCNQCGCASAAQCSPAAGLHVYWFWRSSTLIKEEPQGDRPQCSGAPASCCSDVRLLGRHAHVSNGSTISTSGTDRIVAYHVLRLYSFFKRWVMVLANCRDLLTTTSL